MVTKAKDVDWGELISLEGELHAWLVARGLAKPEDSALTTALQLRYRADSLGADMKAVIHAICDISSFIAAGERTKSDKLERDWVEKGGVTPEVAKLMTDDTVERETDRVIRGITPKLEHIRRCAERIAERQAARGEAMGHQPNLDETNSIRDIVLQRVDVIQYHVDVLLAAFHHLAPSTDHEELTLSGGRKFVKQLRASLSKAGYRPDGPSERPEVHPEHTPD